MEFAYVFAPREKKKKKKSMRSRYRCVLTGRRFTLIPQTGRNQYDENTTRIPTAKRENDPPPKYAQRVPIIVCLSDSEHLLYKKNKARNFSLLFPLFHISSLFDNLIELRAYFQFYMELVQIYKTIENFSSSF